LKDTRGFIAKGTRITKEINEPLIQSWEIELKETQDPSTSRLAALRSG
jgi:hypothetical protein